MTQKLQNNGELNNYFKELSIRVNLDRLSFCVFNPVLNYVEAIYNFPMNFSYKTPQEMERQIHEIIEGETDLRRNFDDIRMLHNSPNFALIPQPLRNRKEEIIEYLKYSIDVTDVPAHAVEIDRVPSIETINAYLPNAMVNNTLLSYYGHFNYQHFTTLLLRMFLERYISRDYGMMYIYAKARSFYFVTFKGRRLHYFNRSSYGTTEDFLYYILFSIEQLDVNTKQVVLCIAGELDPTVLSYSRVRRYVKYIYLLEYHKEHYIAGMDEELIRHGFVSTQPF